MKFPKSFIFGIAESDLQTVGSLYPQENEKAQKTMWEQFAKEKKIDSPLYGSHKYKYSQEDIRLIGNLGVKGYRTSVSMSRILQKDGGVNKKAIQWYRDYLGEIKKNGAEIHLCLYHWEAPEKFAEHGILHPEFQEYFLRHTDAVLEHLSDLADYIIPMNEIWCMSFLSYLIGIHAPGRTNVQDFFTAYFASIELQAKVIQRIKEYDSNLKVGIVNIHFPSYIQTENLEKKSYIKAQHIANNITNFIYSDPFYKGTIDPEVICRFKSKFPKNYRGILANARVGDMIDYYGVNYYNSQYIKPAQNDLGYEPVIPEGAMVNSLGWPIALPPHYPSGLADMLSMIYHRYDIRMLIVSENGTPLYTAPAANVTPQDDFRIFIIKEHLKQIESALQKGVPVHGYFLWTLLDNYEWQEGYKPESAFGIVQVDHKTGKRTPKASYYWYQNFLKNLYRSYVSRTDKLS